MLDYSHKRRVSQTQYHSITTIMGKPLLYKYFSRVCFIGRLACEYAVLVLRCAFARPLRSPISPEVTPQFRYAYALAPTLLLSRHNWPTQIKGLDSRILLSLVTSHQYIFLYMVQGDMVTIPSSLISLHGPAPTAAVVHVFKIDIKRFCHSSEFDFSTHLAPF